MPKMRSIAEFGCGKRPLGLVKKALKAQDASKKRNFLGVDIDSIKAERTAKRIGLAELPKNVSFVSGDAIEQAKKLLPQSKDIIFASNLFTHSYADYSVSQGVNGALERKIFSFLAEAKKALRPNGRIIFIQQKMDAPAFQLIGKQA